MELPVRYKPSYRVEVVGSDQIFLFSEGTSFLLKGEVYALISPFLTEGKLTLSEIVGRLEEPCSLEELYYAFHLLEKNGHIEFVDYSLPDSTAAFYHLLGISPAKVCEKLKKTKINLVSFGNFELASLKKVLEPLGVEILDRREKADLTVVLTENYLNASLKEFNRDCYERRQPWLLLKPKGVKLWIGPLFNGKKKGCWECLATWFQRLQVEEAYVQNKKGGEFPFAYSLSSLPITQEIGIHWAAMEILKWIFRERGEASKIEGKILSFDLKMAEVQEHTLIPLLDCSCCGQERGQPIHEIKPFALTSRAKERWQDGGYRCVDPESTIKNLNHHISPLLGILSSICASPPEEDSPFHVYSGGHNFSLFPPGGISGDLRGSSSGKGKNEAQAKASCLCETIERYSGKFQGNEVQKKSSFLELGDEAIHLNRCLLISERQYQTREQSNFSAISKHRIPEPFRVDQKISWTPVWSMTQKRERYLPTSFCYFGYFTPQEPLFCYGSSNGCAAGNFLEEAVLQGFFELIERDSVAIWWYNQIRRPAVDLTSFRDPFFSFFIKEYEKKKRRVWVLDLTTDLEIPSFVALSRSVDQESQKIIMGFGSHLDPSIAISRALTEMNQMLSGCFNLAPSTHSNQREKTVQNWFLQAKIREHPYLQPEGPSKTAADYSLHPTGDFLEDIAICQAAVEKKGMEMLVLDQSRPETDLKVVRIIVPGLRHFYPHFAPGRLYDVPIKLGWRKLAKVEIEMNPTPMFL